MKDGKKIKNRNPDPSLTLRMTKVLMPDASASPQHDKPCFLLSKMRNHLIFCALLIGLISGCNTTGNQPFKMYLEVQPCETDLTDIPVYANVELPDNLNNVPAEEISVVLKEKGKISSAVAGQIVIDEQGKTQLWWILPRAKKNMISTWIAELEHRKKSDKKTFFWQDKTGEYLDLLFDGRKVTRYMYAYDDSTPQRFSQTYKPFLNIFDLKGEKLITNSGEPNTLYPHHRGLMIGWMKTDADGRKHDFWHMKAGVQKHIEFTELAAGPVLARSTALISWQDLRTGKPILLEQRQTTVFRQGSPTILLLDFDTELKAVDSNVTLDGDPEHAGFQYRAHSDIAIGPNNLKAAYLFPDDKINPHRDFDLPWVGMSYGLYGKHYSVQYMNNPENPKPEIYSAYRDYGRFGAFFTKKIPAGQTLNLSYRIWVIEDKMPSREKLAQKYAEYIAPPTVKVQICN